MVSPPPLPLQGSSCITDGILHRRAFGNALNYADFSHENDNALTLVKPDFIVQLHLTVFLLSGTLLLAQPLLKRAAQLHDSIQSKYYY